jgi:general secretion pathway protein I
MTRNREAGFSLLEVLVAFAIASLALSALVQVYAGSAAATRRSGDILAALEVAENRIAELAVLDLAPGTLGPSEEGAFVWQVDIAPEERPAAGAPEEDAEPPPLRLLLVTVTVRGAGDEAPLVTLATARHALPAAGAETR